MTEPCGARRGRASVARRRWVAALVGALMGLAPLAGAWAQDPTDGDVIRKRGDRPGVIRRGGDDKKEAEDAKGGDAKGGGDDKDAKGGGAAPPKGPEPNNPLANEDIEIEANFEAAIVDEAPIPNGQMITIDFRKAELEDVVKFFSKLLKKNFIIADSLKAGKKITIIAPRQVSVQEAYRAFLSAMAMNGLTIVPHGAFLKIIDANKAQQDTVPTRVGAGGVPGSDVMETRIVQVEHVSLQDVEGVISKLKTNDAQILSYPPTNSLIITEYGTNLKRLLRVMSLLDKPGGGDQIHLYQVQYADASELAGRLLEIFEQDDGRSGGGSNARRSARSSNAKGGAATGDDEGGANEVTVQKIIADENTNQLIIIANERSYNRIVDLIQKLDVETNSGRIWVYPLAHADAEELSGVLSSLASSSSGGSSRNTSRTTSRSSRRSNSSNSSNAGGSGGNAGGGGGGSSTAGAALLSGDVQVSADTATNSLIIVASFKDYVAMKSVIEQLDRRRKQVYVEAAIMEISLDRNRRFGIGVNAGLPQEFDFIPEDAAAEIGKTGVILGQANFDGSQFLESIQGQGGLGFGVIGPSVTIPGTQFSLPAFLLFLQTTQTDQNVNILSTPSILTLDNEEAEIVVGERVPFFTGGLGGLGNLAGLGGLLGGAGGGGGNAALGGLGGLGSNVDRVDVALTMRIVPQINASGLVRLEVEVTVEDLKPGAGDSPTPATTNRELKTVVVAEDQQTIVIGGLMRDVENEGQVKVPFLGDIPILGRLFRRTNTTIVKQNLVLVLTPYVIDSEEDIRQITEQKMEEREEFLRWFSQYDNNYIARTNFNRKHGLLEEINQKVRKSQEDESARRRAYGDDLPGEDEVGGDKGEQGGAAPEPIDEGVPAPEGGDIIIVPGD